MDKDHVGEIVGIYQITKLMPYKHSDGHTIYEGICTICGFVKTGKFNDFKNTKICKHIGADGQYVKNTKWTNSRIGKIFKDIKQRCYNDSNKDYCWYGAKGIKICDEWLKDPKSFENWAIKNGYADDLTIDRIDENKNYCPDNCRWILNSVNAKYKSTTSYICVNGVIHSGNDWSKILGFCSNLINKYVKKYGLENTIVFIERYLDNPNLKPSHKQSYYDLYMN